MRIDDWRKKDKDHGVGKTHQTAVRGIKSEISSNKIVRGKVW